ncbi:MULTISPECIES: hypothetical protein [unclassified Streptomyces]|uniref:hypothetical protein n=1 Tax=unclassified Streptomyces TaxID=2593676 RepID=UPI000805E8A5|nr:MULTISPECIES: hypothetical protein [unclassified Streptomyces]MYR75092.1 hypothetical protein [Streptomyces sp. SID4925]SBU97908.1 hypothetical protein YUMDRAFT_05962 [Streptomyces sp. OspMP-M45]
MAKNKARDELLAAISFNDAANTGRTPEELIAAYRAEVLHRAAALQDSQASCDAIRRRRNIATGRRLVAADLRAMADDATEEAR